MAQAVSSKHCPVVSSHISMQSFRRESCFTPQDDEAAFGEMDVQGTGLVDMYELADALRVMGKSECEIQQLLASISVNVVPPTAAPKVTGPNLRKTHDLPVSRGKTVSADEESLDYTSDVSVIDEMGPVSSKTFRKLGTRTRQVPRCWYGSQCPWHRRGRCLFQHNEVRESFVTGEENFKAELNALWSAFRKLAATLMWRTGSSLGANAAATLAATATVPVHHEVRQEQIAAGETTRNTVENPTVLEQVIVQKISELQVMERIQDHNVESFKEDPQECVQQRTAEQIVRMPVPTVQVQRSMSGTSGGQVVERIREQIVETIPQERVQQRTVEQNVCMSVPTVQEQVFVPEKPGSQVVERIQEHIVESIDQGLLDELRHDWSMGAFEPENDEDEDGRRERKPSRMGNVKRTRLRHPDVQ